MEHEESILVRYLDGTLSETEHSRIMEELEHNLSLQDELERLKMAREAIRMYGHKERVRTLHHQMMKELQSSLRKKGPDRRLFRYAFSAAAAVLLLAGGFILYNMLTISPEKIFSSRYQTFEPITFRGPGDTASMIEQSYRNREYSKVLQLGNTLRDVDTVDLFLSGAAAMEIKEYPTAIKCFSRVLDLNATVQNKLLQDESEYYLALSYLGNKEYKKARILFKSIRSDPEHPYHEKVTAKLIRQLKWLSWK